MTRRFRPRLISADYLSNVIVASAANFRYPLKLTSFHDS